MTQSLLYVGLVCVFGSGCETLRQQQMNELRARTEADNLRRDVAQLKDQVQYLRQSHEQLLGDLEQLRASIGAGDRSVAVRVDALEAAVGESGRARQQIKTDLIKILSERIVQAIEKHRPQAARDYSSGGFTAREHVVKRGETLSAIAAAYGAKVSAIVQANGLPDANSIREGQKLLIPE